MKRILSIFLAVFVLVDCCVNATAEGEARDMKAIRVFNVGAEISVKLTGTADAAVSVMMFKPGIELPDVLTDYAEFQDGIVHVAAATLDENGRYTYKYTATEQGVYTVYVKGADIDYSAVNNDAPLNNPDRIYAEAWHDLVGYSHPDISSKVNLTKEAIDKSGVTAVAANIKAKLDQEPEGRKTIFITNSLSPKSLGGGRIWWDAGMEPSKAYIDAFFKEFRDIGGNVDFVYTDTEQTYSMYHITPLGAADRLAVYNEISSDPRYPEFEAKLVERGYDLASDKNVPLSSVCDYYNKYDNYLKFNAVCAEYAQKYLDEAYYQTIKKYFANVKFSDYGSGDGKLWMGSYTLIGQHPSYIGGNGKKIGTHATPIIYSKQIQNLVYQEFFGAPGQEGASERSVTVNYLNNGKECSDFEEMQGGLHKIRTSALVNEGKFMPWIATEPIQSESFEDTRYQTEMLMHVMMNNPDRLLYYNESTDAVENPRQAKYLVGIMDEVNGLIAYPDRRSVNTDRSDIEIPLVFTGMYSNGRNVWRITPDTAIVSSEAFLVSADGEDPSFSAGGVTVTFPQGSIINVENTVSDIGYWVETPEGVTPVTIYPEELKAFEEQAIISYYNHLGQKADPTVDETFDVVAAYRGMYDGKMNFIAAKYDEYGRLIDAEVKECGVFSPNGNAFFLNMSKKHGVDTIKFFLWKDDNLRPLVSEEL